MQDNPLTARRAIRMISAGQWLDFLQHLTSPTSEKTRPCFAALWSFVVNGNKKFSQKVGLSENVGYIPNEIAI